MNRTVSLAGLAGLLAAPGLGRPAQAAEAPPPKAYVVLIGINDFADRQIKPRLHAEADAKALYDLFTHSDYLGVDAGHVRLLLGRADSGRKSRPATRANILDAAQWLAREAKRDDLMVFAYFGRGAPAGVLGTPTCYLAADSTVRDLAADGVPAAEIARRLDGLASRRFCALLDVDFEAFTGDGARPWEPAPGAFTYKEFLGNADGGNAPGRFVCLAFNPFTPHVEGREHGLFAEVVVDGLRGAPACGSSAARPWPSPPRCWKRSSSSAGKPSGNSPRPSWSGGRSRACAATPRKICRRTWPSAWAGPGACPKTS